MRRGILTTKIYFILIVIVAMSVFPVNIHSQPRRGGGLKVISTGGDVPCIGYGPDLRTFYQMFYTNPVCETLFRWDEKGNISPHLATGWKFSNDLKSITLSLR